MQNHPLRSFILVSFTLLSACASVKAPSSLMSTKDTAILNLVDHYFEENLKLNPLFATSIGDHRFDAELTIPLSADWKVKNRTLIESSLLKAKSLGCEGLAESTHLTCLTFMDDLEAELNLLNHDLSDELSLHQFDSFFSEFAEISAGSSYVSFETKNDYENFLNRMHQIPGYFDELIHSSRTGIKKNVVLPRALVKKSISQLEALVKPSLHATVFYKPLLLPKLSSLKLSPQESASLEARYSTSIQTEILPAYQKLLHFMKTEYLPASRSTSGVGSLRGGKEYYRALARMNTTTLASPDEMMALGLKEVSRIEKEFKTVQKELGFKGTLPQFFNWIRKDPKIYPFTTAEEVMKAYEIIHQDIMKRVSEHFRLMPKERFEIRQVESFRAESASEAYQNGTLDGSRPGIFWVPIPDPKRYTNKTMESLFLHEAIPGHHFQISIQQEQDLPRYRKFNANNAYTEGWGLYAESLGKDLGIYVHPLSWVGRLENEMHRAIRLVVDTGIHWKGWSRELAIRYSLQHEPLDLDGATAEIERYMAIPGQALSYKMGEMKLIELKNFAKRSLGSRYQDADFHDQILKDGALPLSVLDRKIEDWIKRQ